MLKKHGFFLLLGCCRKASFTYKMFPPPINSGRRKNLVKMTADPNATKSWDKRSFSESSSFLYWLGIYSFILHMRKNPSFSFHISASVCNNFFSRLAFRAKARKLIANIVLTCLWEKLAKEKKSLFLLFLPSFAARGGFERNEMGRGRMSLGCFIIALSFSSGRLQSCFVLPSWKLAELKEGRTIKTILNTVSWQLEFISWRVNQFLWVSTKPCKPPMKSFYIGSNVIITLLSFFLL